MKASRSQGFPLNLEQTTNTECLPQKVEWLIIMAACFHLVPSASGSCFLKTAVTGELTCERAHRLQLHIKRLADALIPAQWERVHERPRRQWVLWSSSKSKLYNRWREDGETTSQQSQSRSAGSRIQMNRADHLCNLFEQPCLQTLLQALYRISGILLNKSGSWRSIKRQQLLLSS